MRAVRVHQLGGPEVLQLEELPDPTPGPGQLLIDVEAIGVNFIEIYHREGLYPVPRPFTPGSEAAGVVRAVGPGVADVKPGERVVSQSVQGAYADRALVAAEPHVVLERHRGELLRVAVDQVEELQVPGLVVEAGAVADHLVRQAAGADDRDLQVFGVGTNRLP